MDVTSDQIVRLEERVDKLHNVIMETKSDVKELCEAIKKMSEKVARIEERVNYFGQRFDKVNGELSKAQQCDDDLRAEHFRIGTQLGVIRTKLEEHEREHRRMWNRIVLVVTTIGTIVASVVGGIVAKVI